MSLDVSLKSEEPVIETCHHCGSDYRRNEYYYEANITHNLGSMANAAGIYEALWRPEEIEAKKAKDIVERLKAGLTWMKNEPDRFKQFNPSNGWGSYEALVSFVSKYLEACEEYPEAIIEVSR